MGIVCYEVALLCGYLLGYVVMGSVVVPGNIRTSASITDRSVEGLSELNLNIVVPFQVKDYIVGFRSAVNDLKKVPDSLFARKTFDTGVADTQLNMDANYRLADHNIELAAKISSQQYGASLFVDGDIASKVRNVEVRKQVDANDVKISLLGGFHAIKKRFNAVGSISRGQTSAAVKYDTESRDPLVAVTQSFDRFRTEVTPSLYLKSKLFGCAFTRHWNGGHFSSIVSSDKKALFAWRDETSTGSWTTSAEITVPTSFGPEIFSIPTKISVSRDWKC